MDQPRRITISTDGITSAQKATAKFQTAYREMYAQLSSPGFAQVLCAHEAAHVVFFSLIAKREVSYESYPATLIYDPKIDDYTGNLASVRIIDMPQYEGGSAWDWLHQIACGLSAGGVVARKLMPAICSFMPFIDGGDGDDKERFKQACDGVAASNPGVKIDIELLWKKAQEAVAQMLNEQIIMEGIKAEAARLQEKLGL
jgi:hypothetical protein